MPRRKDAKCQIGCGKFLKRPNGTYCTTCGLEYRTLKKQKRYSNLSDEKLFEIARYNIEQRRRKRNKLHEKFKEKMAI